MNADNERCFIIPCLMNKRKGSETRPPRGAFIVEHNMTAQYENQKMRQGYTRVIGCDEVGRGSLAGPVVAGAVILPTAAGELKVKSYKVYKVIRDSKLLSPGKREELALEIKKIALAWSVAEVSSGIIDKINIHNASLLAMKRAVRNLCRQTGVNAADGLARATDQSGWFLFLDGKFPIPECHLEQEAVIGGDNKILSVAAASIIAKVYRDDLMRRYHKKYPIYNFACHKGYATFHHRQVVKRHGLSEIHRVSFCKNIKARTNVKVAAHNRTPKKTAA